MSDPYLSIVVSASNADYGGGFLNRFQNCVTDKSCFANAFLNGKAELIIVEWNPPPNRETLASAIKFYDSLPTTIFTVSKELHDRYYNPGGFSFLEYMAKNVGIRRASGKYVLSTNADVLFSVEMCQRLAGDVLNGHEFYRANRYDYDRNGNVFQVNYAHGTFQPWEEHVGRSKTGVPYSQNMPHFNASGDFMMMSKENWMRLRAYPENTGYMITLDGEMVHIALTAGLKQVILPEPIYHQFHEHNPVKPWYMPPDGWSDATPRGRKNQTDYWGLADQLLPEQRVA